MWLLNLSNTFMLQWVSTLPTSTGTNLIIYYPTAFTAVYSVAGIALSYDVSVSTSKSPYHDTVTARSAVLQANSETNRVFQTNCVILRRPDQYYRVGFIAVGYKS